MPDKSQVLRPLDANPKTYNLGAFDTETIGTDATFQIGGIYVNNHFTFFNDKGEMVKEMLKRKYEGYRFYAHNLSYDYGVLLQAMSNKHEALFINGKTLFIKNYTSKKNRTWFTDSWMLAAHMSLESVGRALGQPKLPTPNEFLPETFQAPTWYCLEHQQHECDLCYLKEDCVITYNFVDLLQQEINRLGGELKYTLASTAMDLFRRKHLHETYFTPFPFRNGFARLAYYGGRVEPFIENESTNVNIYDVNSLYPYVMREFSYPDPNYLEYRKEDSSINFIMDYDGVSEVTIHVPQTHIPVLPFRLKEKLFFPHGTFRGVYTHVELRKAIERGATIEFVHKQIYALVNCSPFISYVDTLYTLRLQYKATNDPRELIIKILLNSLYGKFGQRNDSGLEKLVSFDDWEQEENQAGYETVVYDDIMYFRKPVSFSSQPGYINVFWAAYITAYARLTLYKYLEMLDSAVIYCDTDSIFTREKLPTGKGLGELKLEYENVDVLVLGAKLYQIWKDGELQFSKARGVPKRYQDDYIRYKEVEYQRSLGFFEAHIRNLPPSSWVSVVKHLYPQYPKRYQIANSSRDGLGQLTSPHSYENLVSVFGEPD